MCSVLTVTNGQRPSHQVDHICSRVAADESIVFVPEEDVSEAVNGRQVSCQFGNHADFAALNKFELFNFLRNESNPEDCIYRILFDYNSIHTQDIFTSDKIIHVATNAIALANQYNGSSNNGLYGVITYLSLASQMSIYFDINYSNTAWNRMRNLTKAMVANNKTLNETSLSLRINAELFNAIAAPQLSGTPDFIPFVRTHLINLANDTYEEVDNIYDYYYCYYFLLDVYLRFAPNNSAHINTLVSNSDMLVRLKNSAINMNLNEDTYQHFDDISRFTVKALSRYAPNAILASTIEPALTEITEAYPENSIHWITAAIGLVENDLPFSQTEEEIVGNLISAVLPNDHVFDDGKFIISTPLSYEESKELYEASREVRAQFFRLFQDDQALPEDVNDTLRVKLYGTPFDYQNFNGILFDIDFPNSGGVYIELFGTFYTYDRSPEESNYTVEELFRHEYAHYLQGRYLIPGTWAGSPYYDNSRLVWFEEGMAQFLSGSTKRDGIKGLQVVRERLAETTNQTLTDVFNSSYSSGNQDAFYIYGSMLWSWWYDSNRSLIKQMMGYIRNTKLTDFDNTVDFYKNSASLNNQYQSFINAQLPIDEFWFTPATTTIDPSELDFTSESALQTEVLQANSSLDIQTIIFQGPEDERTFQISGQMPVGGSVNNPETLVAQLESNLDQLMTTLSSSSLNGFAYANAYFINIQTGPNAFGDFVIEGPANEGCTRPKLDEFQSQGFTSFAYLFGPSSSTLRHQFRYREIGADSWIVLGRTNEVRETISNLTSFIGYEYQMRRECEAGMWTPYSRSKYFHACPDQRDLSTVTLNFDVNFHAANKVSSSGVMAGNSTISLVAGNSVELGINFEVEQGTTFLAAANDCRKRQ